MISNPDGKTSFHTMEAYFAIGKKREITKICMISNPDGKISFHTMEAYFAIGVSVELSGKFSYKWYC